ncbi:hypothetical protein LTS18_014714, partial [Coniosporium uncinatum]
MAAGRMTPSNSPKPKRGKKNDGVAANRHFNEVDDSEHEEIEVVPEAVAITKSSLRSAASKAGPEAGSVTTSSPTPDVTRPENTIKVLIVSLRITPDALKNIEERRASSTTIRKPPAGYPQVVVTHSPQRHPNYGRKSVGGKMPPKTSKDSYASKASIGSFEGDVVRQRDSAIHIPSPTPSNEASGLTNEAASQAFLNVLNTNGDGEARPSSDDPIGAVYVAVSDDTTGNDGEAIDGDDQDEVDEDTFDQSSGDFDNDNPLIAKAAKKVSRRSKLPA